MLTKLWLDPTKPAGPARILLNSVGAGLKNFAGVSAVSLNYDPPTPSASLESSERLGRDARLLRARASRQTPASAAVGPTTLGGRALACGPGSVGSQKPGEACRPAAPQRRRRARAKGGADVAIRAEGYLARLGLEKGTSRQGWALKNEELTDRELTRYPAALQRGRPSRPPGAGSFRRH